MHKEARKVIAGDANRSRPDLGKGFGKGPGTPERQNIFKNAGLGADRRQYTIVVVELQGPPRFSLPEGLQEHICPAQHSAIMGTGP